MKVIYKDTFVNRLENQLDFIAKDNPNAAKKFQRDLLLRIKEIPKNPLSFRKSIYFDDAGIRDLIFKGYTIVFRINNKLIEVFGFVKFQEKSTD